MAAARGIFKPSRINVALCFITRVAGNNGAVMVILR
jgi:hypothetical protein